MPARKRRDAEEQEPTTRSGAGGMIGATIILTAAIIGAFIAWQQWGPAVVDRAKYKLVADNVTIPETPPWIANDIRAEVFRDGSLADSSVLEHGLTKRVCDAFEMHPWVAKVNRVNMQPPAGVAIDLEYRRPIAWVQIPDGMFPDSPGGVLPIDRHAFVLPQDGFQEELPPLLIITIDRLRKSGPTGTAWGDPRVSGAAEIAAVLGDDWRELGIAGITGIVDYSVTSSLPTTRYELFSPHGKRIIWGSAPQRELTNEPDANQKLQLLSEYVRRNGPIDSSDALGLDLRDAESVLARRTATRPAVAPR